MNTLKLLAGASLILGALSFGTPAARAADISDDPSLQDIIQKLTPPKMRGIRKAPAGDESPSAAQPAATAPAAAAAPAPAPTSMADAGEAKIDLRVQFEFNSDTLSPQAATVLSRLGEAIQSTDLRTYKFLIVGHTDAKGSAAYNQNLSERRAASVRDYLVQMLKVEPHRLTSIGKGESAPLTPNDPNAGVNRRVEVRTLGG